MCWPQPQYRSTVSCTHHTVITLQFSLICRAILHGVGAANDPDKIDNYNKARAFPIAYSADDDPEVVNEMKIAVEELREGNDKDKNEQEMLSDESSEESGEDEWEDNKDGSKGQSKKKRFFSVDKMCFATLC